MANHPLNDPRLESFAARVAGGESPAAAYRAIYNTGAPVTRQACYTAGKIRMGYPMVRERIRQIQVQLGQLCREHPVKPDVKSRQADHVDTQPAKLQRVTQTEVKGDKNGLIKRLWETVLSEENSASTAAAKQLYDWYDKEDQQAADAAQLDPSVIVRYFTQYAGRVCDSDELSGILRALINSLRVSPSRLVEIVNRDFNPPLPQTPANIEPNEPTLPDMPPISNSTSIA
jgi:hypothetical protein